MGRDDTGADPGEATSSAASVLQYVVDNIPYLIFWKDTRSVYLGCNKNFAALDGKSDPRELVGRTDFDMAWKEHAALYRAGDLETMTRGEAILDKEERSIDAAGNETIILTSKVPLRNAAGEVSGLLGIIVDITARKRLELELQRAKEDADRAAQAKSDFIANISHELRTPLTLILGPLGRVLSDPGLSEDSRRALESARRNGLRLHELVSDVLDFSRAQAAPLVAQPEPLELVRALGALVLDVQPEAALRGLSLSLECALERLDVLLDPRLLERMLLNLLVNALKFTPAGGRVCLRVALGDEGLRLTVEDDGIGIPRAALGTLFEKFTRVDNAATRAREGTGLGLALVQLFARAHGGRVEVESEEGKGSAFSLVLPYQPCEPVIEQAPRAGRAWRAPANLSTPTPSVLEAPGKAWVLVAEDNDELRRFTMEVLSSDFSVVGVADGAAAWRELGKRRFDVVVSDVMMPELDGLGLTAKIKAHHALRTLPVILVTARGGDANRGLDAGADDYVNKPFEPEELLARVRAAQRMKALQDELRRRSHEAGKQAVAGGVLHNVGNVLNSVKVSAELIERTSDSTALRSLERMAAIWAEACPDAASTVRFVTEDERGRRFGAVLGRVCAELREQQEELAREARAMVEGVEHAASIVTCELSPGGAQAPAEAVELGALLARAVKLSQDGSSSVDVIVRHGPLPVLYIDPHGLLGVLINVLKNARQAVARVPSRPGRIELEARHEGDRLIVRVTDDGAGIRAEDLPLVFQQGFGTSAGGHGLGLHMSALALARLGGSIEVTSEGPGRGATFVLELPLERAPRSRELSVAVA